MAKKGDKVKVSKRALIQRINRILAKHDTKLHTARGDRARLDLGDYYTVDIRRDYIIDKLPSERDLEAFGRELGALMRYEEMEKE